MSSDSEEMDIDSSEEENQDDGSKISEAEQEEEDDMPVGKKALTDYLENLMAGLSTEDTSVKTVMGHVSRQFDLSAEDSVGVYVGVHV